MVARDAYKGVRKEARSDSVQPDHDGNRASQLSRAGYTVRCEDGVCHIQNRTSTVSIPLTELHLWLNLLGETGESRPASMTGWKQSRDLNDTGSDPAAHEPLAAYGHDPVPPHPAVCGYGGGVRARIHQIKAGLPMACFDELREALACSQESLAAVAGIPGRTLARRRQEGQFRPDEGERVLRLAQVYADVLRLFEGDADAARRWLGTPQEFFEGRTPLEYCDTEPGAGLVRDVVGRLEHGVFS